VGTRQNENSIAEFFRIFVVPLAAWVCLNVSWKLLKTTISLLAIKSTASESRSTIGAHGVGWNCDLRPHRCQRLPVSISFAEGSSCGHLYPRLTYTSPVSLNRRCWTCLLGSSSGLVSSNPNLQTPPRTLPGVVDVPQTNHSTGYLTPATPDSPPPPPPPQQPPHAPRSPVNCLAAS
jgi:hypothetical protein